jgi:hypothetical protein
VGDDTVIVDVSNVLNGRMSIIGIAPNRIDAVDNPNNVAISHQSDITADGKLLVVTDERVAALTADGLQTRIRNGDHRRRPLLGDRTRHRPARDGERVAGPPVKLGIWVNPNPGLLVDPLEPALAAIGRTERACTIHVFRIRRQREPLPGEAYPRHRRRVAPARSPAHDAHYGSGVWWLDFSAPASASDGVAEGRPVDLGQHPRLERHARRRHVVRPRSTRATSTPSDIARGFDVYSFTNCQDAACVVRPTTHAPAQLSGGGKLEQDFATFTILRGSAPGGEAQFGMDVRYVVGAANPVGSLTFQDKGLKRKGPGPRASTR